MTDSFSWPHQPVASDAFIAFRAETLDACGFPGDSPPRLPPIDTIIGTEVTDLFSATTDDKLFAVFDKRQVTMFEMTKLVNPHLS